MWTTSGVGQYRAGERHVAMLPTPWLGDGTRRGVIVCHGYASDALTPVSGGYLPQTAMLARSGIPVLSADLGGSDTWGNDASLAALSDAWSYLKGLGASPDGVLLFGGSMGALTALNWIRENPAEVEAVGLAVPALNLADLHDNDRGGVAASIEAAYGGAAGYAAALSEHNAWANREDFEGVRVRVFYSENDEITLPEFALDLVEAAGAAGDAVSLGAVGHASGFVALPPEILRDFFLPRSVA